MNATSQTHPAESPEFLSRLRDGELSAAETASFEEHRRTCARCRESADTYARALSIFRSASPRPAASDLSARILRKVRAQSPSRRPFGVTFGIDVRWAGVCAAALIVVIMAASILDEGPVPSLVLPASREVAEPESVRARLLAGSLEKEEVPPAKADRPRMSARNGSAAAPAEPGSARRGPAAQEEAGRRQLPAAAPPPSLPSNEVGQFAYAPEGAKVDASAAAPPAAVAEKRAEAKSKLEADAAGGQALADKTRAAARDEQKKNVAVAQAAPRSRATLDAPGGEAGAAAAPSRPDADADVRVSVTATDGLGTAPEVVRSSGGPGLAAFRGREFVLVVESGGRVRSAAPVSPGEKELLDLRANAKAKDAGEDLSPVLALRFEPGERPRRLRVRVE
jgi:hypothetical protein